MSKRREELERALEAAKEIRKTMRSPKSQYMVANTKNHAQLFAFAETKEGAVCAYLERLTSFPDQDKVSS